MAYGNKGDTSKSQQQQNGQNTSNNIRSIYNINANLRETDFYNIAELTEISLDFLLFT